MTSGTNLSSLCSRYIHIHVMHVCIYLHVYPTVILYIHVHVIMSRNIGGNWFGLQLPFGIGLPYIKEILVLAVAQAGCQTMKFTMYMYM